MLDNIIPDVTTTLEQLPLDNYRVDATILTQVVEQHLIKNPQILGVFITENNQVIGIKSRRQFFEQLSKQYSRDLYSLRPIKIMLDRQDEPLLKIPFSSHITEAVKLALNRSNNVLYEPIIITKKDEEMGLLEVSLLILAQAQIFAKINDKLIEQENDLKQYAQKIEQEREKVKAYAQELESQQSQLQQRNELLQIQTEQLQLQTEELAAKSEKITNLNNRFSEVSILVSREGKKTFFALAKSVESIILFTEKINEIGSDFNSKFRLVDQATNLITKINKRVEKLSFQSSIMAANFPDHDERKTPFTLIANEIQKLSNSIAEANTTVNNIAEELKPQINILVKTATENKEVVGMLSRNSQKTEIALTNLAEILEQKDELLI